MSRRKIQSANDQRPFVMVYHDFLESDLLDNYFQRLLYIYLKKFADSKEQCYPSIRTLARISGISVDKVRITLNELKEKGVLTVENRHRSDGGLSSNLYTLHDTKELWSPGHKGDVEATTNEEEELRMIDALKKRGYVVSKEKEPISTAPTKVTDDMSPKTNRFDKSYITAYPGKSQELERYTAEQIRQIYGYEIMINDYPSKRESIDAVMSVLHTTMNTAKAAIRVGGEDKPAMVVIGKLMKLSYWHIMYAIEKYEEQTERIKNPTGYMLTLLYNSAEQMQLDVVNRAKHDMLGDEEE